MYAPSGRSEGASIPSVQLPCPFWASEPILLSTKDNDIQHHNSQEGRTSAFQAPPVLPAEPLAGIALPFLTFLEALRKLEGLIQSTIASVSLTQHVWRKGRKDRFQEQERISRVGVRPGVEPKRFITPELIRRLFTLLDRCRLRQWQILMRCAEEM